MQTLIDQPLSNQFYRLFRVGLSWRLATASLLGEWEWSEDEDIWTGRQAKRAMRLATGLDGVHQLTVTPQFHPFAVTMLPEKDGCTSADLFRPSCKEKIDRNGSAVRSEANEGVGARHARQNSKHG